MSFERLWSWLNPRTSLRARFALLIGGSGVALALLTAAVIDKYQRAELGASQGQALRREALLLARTLESALQQRMHQLRDTAEHPLLASGLVDPGETRLLLENLRGQQPAWAWVAVLDDEGRVQVATNALQEGERLSDEPWFAEARQRPWIGTRRPAHALTARLGLQDGAPPFLIDMALPLIDMQGRRTGVLAARLQWGWLQELYAQMQAPDRHLPGTEAVVVDRLGRVLLGPVAWLDRPLDVPGLAALRDGAAPRVIDWPGEGPFVSAWGRVDDGDAGQYAGLGVWVRQSEQLAFEAADALRWRLLLVGTLAFMALSAWLAGRVARPIRGLSAAAMRVVHDQPPEFEPLSPKRRDEVAGLAQALQALHTELSHRLTEQQRATERYELLYRYAPVAIYVALDDQLQLANDACLTLYGASDVGQLRGKRSEDLIHPDDRAKLRERDVEVRHAATLGNPIPLVEHRILRLDGTVAEVESMAMPLALGELRATQVVLHDVTAKRRALALLREREAQLSQTSRMARLGGWTLDLASQQGTWTDELAAIYEVPPDTRPTPELALSAFRGEDLQRQKAALRQLLKDGTPYDLELRLHLPSGHQKWVRAYGQARWQDGQMVRLEGMTQDITDRRAAQDALKELNAQLERRVAERTAELSAANAELDAFAYAVSHDLRAPLRAMSGFSLALVEDHGEQLPDEARAYLDQIVLGSRRMGELIEGLLVLSRSVRGALRDDEVDLSSLASQAVAELQRADPQRQVSVDIEPGLHARGDRRMLSSVLGNLLGNAWKYTAEVSAPHISFRQSERDGEVWFSVQDNGVGFDMAHAGRLFKAFARLHRQDEFPGLGIGLATVQRIIHRHGGRIEAEARPGQGATFRFTLPAHRAGTSLETSQP